MWWDRGVKHLPGQDKDRTPTMDENFLHGFKAARLRWPAPAPGGQPAGHAALRPVPAVTTRALQKRRDETPQTSESQH